MNMKGYAGHYGLERYEMIDAHNLGSQVLNEELIKRAVELDADVMHPFPRSRISLLLPANPSYMLQALLTQIFAYHYIISFIKHQVIQKVNKIIFIILSK